MILCIYILRTLAALFSQYGVEGMLTPNMPSTPHWLNRAAQL